MTTNAMIGIGIAFGEGDGNSPEVFTDFAEVTNIDPPDAQIDDVEATHYASGGDREYIPGLNENGEMTFDINYIPGSDTDNRIRTLKAARTRKNWRIYYPTSPALQDVFNGYIKGYKPNLPKDDVLTAQVTIKVSGAVSRALAS